MAKPMKKRMIFACAASLMVCVVGFLGVMTMLAEAAEPKHVILFIGDGMGPNQVAAGRMLNGGPLSFDSFPIRGKVTTHSADKEVTDSAASATAIAGGVKVNNGVIALQIPGEGEIIPTMLEYFQAQGKWVGLVSDDQITGATPACFAAHQPSRGLAKQIADDYLKISRPNILFGGGSPGISARMVREEGKYVTATTRDELLTLTKQVVAEKGVPHFAAIYARDKFPYLYHDQLNKTGAYGKTLPHLHEMTSSALQVLERNPKGFFLMVESAHTDKSGHAINTKPNTRAGCNSTAVLELSKSVQVVLDWAKGRNDVLIIVTADHETGGMNIIKDNGPGLQPTLEWSHTSHTATDVDIFAYGPGANQFKGTMDNIDIYKKVAALCEFRKVKLQAATK